MAFFKISIDYGNQFKELDNIFDADEELVKDLRPLWNKLVAHLQLNFAENFGLGQTKWPSLSAAYRAWKEKRFPGNPILVRTGRLFDALTKKSHKDRVDVRELQTFTYGFDAGSLPYGVWHNEGTSKLPKRKFMLIRKSANIRISKEVFNFIKVGFKKIAAQQKVANLKVI